MLSPCYDLIVQLQHVLRGPGCVLLCRVNTPTSKVKQRIQAGWDVHQTVEPSSKLKPMVAHVNDTEKWPAILVACFISSPATVELLIKSKADVNARLSTGFNCVAAALCNEKVTPKQREALLQVCSVCLACMHQEQEARKVGSILHACRNQHPPSLRHAKRMTIAYMAHGLNHLNLVVYSIAGWSSNAWCAYGHMRHVTCTFISSATQHALAP